jgi:hypothetical protein
VTSYRVRGGMYLGFLCIPDHEVLGEADEDLQVYVRHVLGRAGTEGHLLGADGKKGIL